MDQSTEDTRRLDKFPEHESDADVAGTTGGGIMSEGGTAVDRGTGTLGIAQGSDPGEDADSADETDRERTDGDAELDMSSIAYGAAARGSVPTNPQTGALPEAGFVPEGEKDRER